MIMNDRLDLKTPKEALTTFVHNMLNKQFFRHIFILEWMFRTVDMNNFLCSSGGGTACISNKEEQSCDT